ncbi:phosphoribosylanthranilate isomerase [Metabacillus elymi]|uniref:N-(5'-phosphoribosyl)anthranilate isomerase n=1 Tax=Metabacillus elymi TaxID=2745198 RepID=A0ABX6SBN4_9BACI|nr:phosphoribosylanthranilate isomerase [Metabacillus sp. KUDC1714]QNF30668.1 phosphoribosylanthranilate isomerase [Metabacillus sp. KUDC1714]
MPKPLLKFCGIRSLDDLKIVSSSQAEYIGLIFAESKRRVDPKIVKTWLKEVDITAKKLVAVFVNPTANELADVLTNLPIDVIQFHGNESYEDIKKVKETFAGTVWKALHHHSKTIEEMHSFKNIVDGFVIDSRMKGQWGGTGVSFDWSAVPHYIKFSRDTSKLCFIAGGVNESNIGKLLTYHPQGIDLSSGIEVDNKKSKDKIERIEERVLQNVNISR